MPMTLWGNASHPVTNLFLDSLSSSDRGLLSAYMSQVELRRGEALAIDQGSRALVYFPETMVACLNMRCTGTGLGVIGREGLVGWGALFSEQDGDYCASSVFGRGMAQAISVEELRAACRASPTLLARLFRFVQLFSVQISWGLVSAGRDSLMQRLCSLLLMVHDRIEGDVINLTHDTLAALLDVRRPSVTDTLHLVEGDRAVFCTRGRIVVRDRVLLESRAGPAYDEIRKVYRCDSELFGVRRRQAAEADRRVKLEKPEPHRIVQYVH